MNGPALAAARGLMPSWPGWSRLPREARDTLFLLAVIAWTVLPHAVAPAGLVDRADRGSSSSGAAASRSRMRRCPGAGCSSPCSCSRSA